MKKVEVSISAAEVIRASEVVKASAAIQIENSITLFQRRAWTVLLANAYDELPTKERHNIRVKDLMEILEYGSRNYQHLYDSLEALVNCKVKWNILHRDKEWEWGITTLLAEAKVKGGICSYAFGPTLRERLYNPSMFARISLSLQNKFESKHALALWEVCLDYLNPVNNFGETPYITVPSFRQLMGISQDTYSAFKIFNWRVIKEPVAEINAKTDFHITVEYRRRGRRVEAVKFRFRRILPMLARDSKQTSLFMGQTDVPPIVESLLSIGLDVHSAWDIWQQGFNGVESSRKIKGMDFDSYVHEKLRLLADQKIGTVQNPAGFIRQAIKYDWTQTEQKSKSKTIRQKPKMKIATEEDIYDTKHEDILAEKCQQFARKNPDQLQIAIDSVLGNSRFHKQIYDKTLSPMDNYLKHISLATDIDRYFTENFPEFFTDFSTPQ